MISIFFIKSQERINNKHPTRTCSAAFLKYFRAVSLSAFIALLPLEYSLKNIEIMIDKKLKRNSMLLYVII
jgi:hypothetical protein